MFIKKIGSDDSIEATRYEFETIRQLKPEINVLPHLIHSTTEGCFIFSLSAHSGMIGT